jgi:hypothetical protein
MDGVDESWGPKLDAGLMIPQWFSMGAPAPWVSSPNNVRDFFQTGTSVTNNFSATGSSDRANFRLSFGTENLKGIMPTSALKRITAGHQRHGLAQREALGQRQRASTCGTRRTTVLARATTS